MTNVRHWLACMFGLYFNMHICSDFESDAKVRISKPGQGIGRLKRCA